MSRDFIRGFAAPLDAKTLGRIAGELSAIAAAYAEMQRSEGAVPQSLAGGAVSFATAARNPGIAARINAYLTARRSRSTVLEGEWFADPVWDLMLDLLACQHSDRNVSISSACIAAAVPGTTALRWIDRLVTEGALVREDDPTDRRRSYLQLAPDVAARLENWVERNLPPVARSGYQSAA